jgi:hypothetical protein
MGAAVPVTYTPNEISHSAMWRVFTSCAAGSVALAIPYTAAIIYLPMFVKFLSWLVWIFFSAFLGQNSVAKEKAHSPFAACCMAVLGSLVGWYVHWALWLNWHAGGGPGAFFDLLWSPADMAARAANICQVGTWAIFGGDPICRGWRLLVFWAAELLFYVSLAAVCAYGEATVPFDESQQVWYTQVSAANNLFALPRTQKEFDAVADEIRSNDFSYFVGAPFHQSEYGEYFSLSLWTAPCAPLAYLTVVFHHNRKQGFFESCFYEKDVHSRTIIRYGALPASLAKTLEAKMSQIPPPAP